MLYIGVGFIGTGMFLALDDLYDIKILIYTREIVKKRYTWDLFLELKLILGTFSIIIGIFTLVHYFS